MPVAANTQPDQNDPAVRAAQEERLRAVWSPPKGLFLRWTDTNNNAVGIWYTLTAFGMLLFAGVLALIMRAQLAVPENDLVSASTLQSTVHAARLDDDVPVRGADVRGGLGPDPAAVAGRARPAVPSPFRLRLLELPDRRRIRRRLDFLRRRAGRRLVHVPAAVHRTLDRRHRRGHLDAGPVLHRGIVDRRRGRADRGRAEMPAAGHAAQSDAALCLVHAGRGGDDPVRLPAADRRRPAVRNGAPARLAFLRCEARRRSVALAAFVLDFRPSGGLYHLPALDRDLRDDHSDLRAAPSDRLSLDRAGGGRHRLSELRPVGAPYVRHRPAEHQSRLLLGRVGGRGDSDRRADLRVHRHHMGGPRRLVDADALRSGLAGDLRDRRADRRDGGGGALRLAGARYLFRRRPPPLRPDRRLGDPAVRRPVLLLAAGDRQETVRPARPHRLLDDVRRLQPRLLSDAHFRADGHAAPGLHLFRGARRRYAQPPVHARRLSVRGGHRRGGGRSLPLAPAAASPCATPGMRARSNGWSFRSRKTGAFARCR